MKQVSDNAVESVARDAAEKSANEVLLESIPPVELLRMPFLEALQSGRSKLFESVEKEVAQHFNLSSAAQKACLPKAKTSRFENRMKQVRAQLHEEGLIELPQRKKVKLTESGKAALASAAEFFIPTTAVPAPPSAALNPQYFPYQMSTESLDVAVAPPLQEYPYQTPIASPSAVSETASGVPSTTYTPYLGFSNSSDDKNIAEQTPAVASEKRENTSTSRLKSIALILGIVGLIFVFTRTLSVIGILCGIAALVVLFFSNRSTSAYKNAKAATGVGVASVALGAVMTFGSPSAAPPIDADGDNGEPIAVAESFAEEDQGSLAFMVTSADWTTDQGSVTVVVDGQENNGTAVHDYYTALVAETYLLDYGPGNYSFTVDAVPLSTGYTIYRCDAVNKAFDGKSDQVVTIILATDSAATAARAAEKEAAAKAEQERIAAQQQAEAEAKARAEQEAAAAAAAAEAAASEAAQNPPAGQTNEYTVYIGKSGECYHTYNCRTLKNTKTPIAESDAIAQGYRPCKVCKP